MKTFLISLSICFFFAVRVFGQDEPRLQKYYQYVDNFHTGEFRLGVETIYEYNEFGEIHERIQKYYNEDGTLKYWYGRFYTYNAQNLLEKIVYRRYNRDVDLWITSTWVEYLYDDLGCMLEEKSVRNVGGVYKIVEYERDEKCRNTKETIWREVYNMPELEVQFVFEQEYLADGISYLQKLYRQSSSDSLYLSALRTYLFNEQENLMEYHQTVIKENRDTFFHVKTIYEYDEQHHPTTYRKYYKDRNLPDWVLRSQYFYQNEYDELGFLKKVTTEELLYDGTSTSSDPYDDNVFNYEYTCDGLEKRRIEIRNYNNSTYKFESVYEGEDKCFEIEKVDLNIDVFPNPTTGFVNISSPILASGNTQIMVFSIDGKVLLQKKEISRCEITTMDLEGLANGFYIIELSNDNYFANEKIIIAK